MAVEIFVFCGWRFSNQLDIVAETLLAAILLTVSCG